ncbi:hypothetical protein [Micromonospora endophytica]|nr:hypothetical protein Jiend_34290 [Micromonospora endophytica]
MPVIEVTNLHKRYGETVAVHDVSFEVAAGEICSRRRVNRGPLLYTRR